jgi:uncharacterized DUF497 family protein
LQFDWSDNKNRLLKENRSVCFEDVVVSINNGNLLDTIKNQSSNHAEQYCMIVDIGGYAYVVPFVLHDDVVFLKTVYPSRKMTKKYLGDKQ